MSIQDLTYTNDVCRLVLNKPISNATGGSTVLAGTPSTLTESNFGSPEFLQDFAQTKSFDTTFWNALSTSDNNTYYDSNGYLQSAPIGQMRFTQDPYTKRSLGCLLEANSNGNVFTLSSTAGGTPTSTNAISYLSTTTVNPRNVSSATTQRMFSVTTANAQHYAFWSIAQPGDNICYSAFFKQNSGTIYPVMIIDDGGGTGIWAQFDLTNGTVVQSGNLGGATLQNTGVQKLPNGWMRCWVGGSRGTLGGGSWFRMTISATSNTTPGSKWYTSETLGVGDSFMVFGQQLDAGLFNPTSYWETPSTARNGDGLTLIDAKFAQIYNPSEGTWFMEFNTPVDVTTGIPGSPSSGTGTGCLFEVRGDVGDVISIGHYGYLPFMSLLTRSFGVPQTVALSGGTLKNGLNKIAISYNSYSLLVSLNGVTLQEQGFRPTPRMRRVAIMQSFEGTNSFNGCISKFGYYARYMGATTIAALTAPQEC